MDPLLLKYYERELQFIKEMGSEYASEYPKIAGRLGIDSIETSDPYVERLYEGFAFLAARVQLRIDAQYPRFTQNLLSIIYPQFLTPTPSMAIVQFTSDTKASLELGQTLPRGTELKSTLSEQEQTPCQYRTAHEITLWPIEVVSAEYFSNMGSVATIPVLEGKKSKAGLRIKFKTTAQLQLSEVQLDKLDVYLSGHTSQAIKLYEQLFGNRIALVIRCSDGTKKIDHVLDVAALEQLGFDDQQSLFVNDSRSFSGYRLLREYFAFSDRFLFARFKGLLKVLEQANGQVFELIVLFDRYDVELENSVDKEDFSLNCTPVINLFQKRADRLHLNQLQDRYHVVVDRTRPLDFEVFQIESVTGLGDSSEQRKKFLPFYQCNDVTDFENQQAYFSVNRERRLISQSQRRQGLRSNYIGSESYISLVDSKEAPYQGSLKQLEISILSTNRDLPLKMSVGKQVSDFSLDISAPVTAIKCIKGPTKPRPSLSHKSGETAWKLINHLSINYLSLKNSGPDNLAASGSQKKNSNGETGAAALREMLSLYGDGQDAAITKQIEGLRSIDAVQVTRRIPIAGPIAFGRGLEISAVFDESAFVGSGVFLLGSVLDRFFARYVSINSFTITVVKTEERGEIMRWPIRIGQKQIV